MLSIGGGCPWNAEDGDIGATGSSGQDGQDGQDAVIASYSYEFNPVGNPYIKSIPVINLTDVKSGKQTVTVYTLWEAGEWVEQPRSFSGAGVFYEDIITVGHQFVEFETLADGVLFGGDACFGANCRVIVKVFNK